MDRNKLSKEVDWFCYHLVSERVLTLKECISVINCIEENDMELTLELFINVVLDNGLNDNAQQLNEFKAMAEQEAKIFGAPQRSVFDEPVAPQAASAEEPADAAPVQAELQNEAPPSAVPNDAVPQEPQPQAAPQMDAAAMAAAAEGTVAVIKLPPLPVQPGQEWLAGWPQLSQAEFMDRDQAIELLQAFLHRARQENCSDVHISTGAFPFIRRYKQIHLLPGQEVLTAAAAERLNLSPLNEEQLAAYNETHDLDYSYNVTLTDRYRTNVMKQRQGVAGSYRIIDTTVRSIAELGFRRPEIIEKLTSNTQGLILVTGPAGSGKSSTLTALVDHINKTRKDHIITVEDPIEMVHTAIGCNITQRELNNHTKSFGNALRAALREDPDVIVIGELRDLETIEMAIHSSETGHLVIGTLHTSSAADTMTRLLDVFPHGQQAQIRSMVAESLKGVICQQLVQNKNGDGVVLATEILLGNLAVSNLIREGKNFQLESTMQTSKNVGMSTMEQSYFDLYMDGKLSYEQISPMLKNPDLIRQAQQNEAALFQQSNGGEKPKKKGWF